jgi:sigma-54 specific flagellar transcriptional regulator A
MESELFGHEKGAFTGADRRNIGRFELANSGTLFLDEIGDLLLPLQVKLLRALEERTIERIGSCSPIPVDFRLICATHRDLKSAVAEDKFREDLFYRINVVPIRIPALRERPEDIVPLAQHFFSLLRTPLPKGPESIDSDALKILQSYSWPGNVRQLRNAIEYALVLCEGKAIAASDLPEDVRSKPAASPVAAPPTPSGTPTQDSVPVCVTVPQEASKKPNLQGLRHSTQTAEAQIIRAALQRRHWKITAVAQELQISRSTLYQRMDLYGIKRPD